MLARQALDNWQLAEVNNWDVSLFKNFPLASELRALQFRWNCTMLESHALLRALTATYPARQVQ